jgi:hypothetical protein
MNPNCPFDKYKSNLQIVCEKSSWKIIEANLDSLQGFWSCISRNPHLTWEIIANSFKSYSPPP